jgi:hypothetical protein
MLKKTMALVPLLFLVAVAALAHGDKKHIVGTLDKVTSESVVVKTAAGKAVEVKLLGSTIFIVKAGAQEKPAKASDLVVGDRVVIHATPKGEVLEANEVKFSKPGSAAAKSK